MVKLLEFLARRTARHLFRSSHLKKTRNDSHRFIFKFGFYWFIFYLIAGQHQIKYVDIYIYVCKLEQRVTTIADSLKFGT